MTTYYIDPAGRDSNNGTATGTPWKTLGFAIAMTSAADEIILQGSSKTNQMSDKYYPDDGGIDLNDLDFSNALTLRGDGMQYFWQGIDVTHGSERPELMPDWNMDAWTDSATPFRLTLTANTVAQETTEIDTTVPGKYINSMYCTEAFSGPSHEVHLVAGRTYKINCLAKLKSGTTAALWICELRNQLNNNYLDFTDSSWTAVNPGLEWGTAGGVTGWEEFSSFYTNTFVPESTTKYKAKFIQASKVGADQGYIQNFSIKDTEPNNWTDEGSNVWSLPGVIMNMATNRVLVTTVADWAANGMLGFPTEDTGYAYQSTEGGMDAAEKSFWFDTSTKELKIHIPSGSTITDFHIELVTSGDVLKFSADSTISNFTAGGAGRLHVATGVTVGITASNVHNLNNMDFCWDVDAGSDTQLTSCSGKRSRGKKVQVGSAPQGDGFTVRGSSAVKLTCIGCEADQTGDEGFENSQGAEIVCIGCFAHRTGWETRDSSVYVSAGFKKTNGGDFTAQNCTAIDCDKYGFGNDDDTEGGLLKLQGCIAKDSTWSNFRLSNSELGNAGTFDIDECIGETESSAADIDPWGDGTNNQLLSNANIKVDSDGELQSDFTEAVGTGTKWWGTDPRPPSASSEPYPDTDVDKGGVQSTWSADHPENL